MELQRIDQPHTKDVDTICREAECDRQQGLSREEASRRLERFGTNTIRAAEGVSAWSILLHNLNNIIVYLLMVSSAAAFFMGDTVEGAAVIVAIFVAVLSGFFTELKAQKSVESLQKMIKTTAKVLRDGEIAQIDSSELVIGDLIYLEEGDSVTADARLVRLSRFAVIESALTGESEAVNKDAEVSVDSDAAVGDRTNMVFAGTAVTRGNAYAVITAAGMDTQMGKISGMLEQQDDRQTPLERQLDRLGKALIIFAAAVAALVSVFGIFAGEDVYEMIKIGIILAIAAIPEALPAVSTITLAIGMRTMARGDALVKNLPAVETLGSTTVICTDKTGTLTENQMTVSLIVLPDNTRYQVTGSGYDPKGEFRSGEKQIDPSGHEPLMKLLKAGVLSSNASLMQKDSLWQVVGDPTEGGIVSAGMKAGVSKSSLVSSGLERIGEIPFDSSQKYMAAAYRSGEEQQLVVKGAPDVIIEMANVTGEARATLLRINEELAAEGMRVLAAAAVSGYSGNGEESSMRRALQEGVELLGFFGIIDPPREDVKQAIAEAQDAGIRVIMITGDHPKTASFIAGKIGMHHAEDVLTGREMDRLSDLELAETIRTVSVFARVSPENKLQIVRALNIDEEVTAMTGDGVNDAPALQGADIGIAMGIRGTEVAKEASDMILTSDRFSTIVDAVRQGRVIFDNIEKFVFFLFSCNVVEIIMIFLAIAFGLPIPLLALQILWLNLVVDVLPAMSLAWEPGEPGIMKRPPRDPARGIMNKKFLLSILSEGALIGIGALAAFYTALSTGLSDEAARTVGFTALAAGQLIHIFNVREKERFGIDRSLLQNPFLLGALGSSLLLQLAAVYLPFMQAVMGTVPLAPEHLLLAAAGAVLPTLAIQALRSVIRRAG